MSDRHRRLLEADRAMGLRTAPRIRSQPTSEARSRETPASMTAAVVASPMVKLPEVRPQAAHPAPRQAMAPEQRAAALEALRVRHDAECAHCTVATSHTRTVFGEGSATARLMFIGEAPGENEDRTGRPFVGRAGEKLDEMIAAMGMKREQVYVANVLKSRPPENRTPLQHEVDACSPFLIEQILVIRPEAIVTLGGPATKLLLGTEEGITRLRGIWSEWRSPDPGSPPIPVMPTYHPAYLLRNYTPKTRGEIWADLLAVMDRLGIPRPKRANS